MRRSSTRSRRSGRTRSASQRFALDTLEPRLALSTVTWDGGGGDNLWSNPLNWSTDVLPGPDDDVDLIDPSGLPVAVGPGFVVADAGPIEIRSLKTYRSLVLNAGVEMRIERTLRENVIQNILPDLRVNGSLAILNQDAPPGEPTRIIFARVQAGGQFVLGSPTGDQTAATVGLLNQGRVRFQNVRIAGLGFAITNAEDKTIEFSHVSSAVSALNSGTLRVDGAAGSRSDITLGHLAVQGAVVVERATATFTTRDPLLDVTALGPDAKVHIQFDIFGPEVHLRNATLGGSGTIGLSFQPDQTLQLGNTIFAANVLIDSSVPILVRGGRLTITGSLSQVGDDLRGDIYGTGQVLLRGTLHLGGSARALSAPLIIEPGGRLETTGPLTLLTSSITNRGTITRAVIGTTRITGSLDNGGVIDARHGAIELLGPITQLLTSSPGVHSLSGGEWIARNNATLAWPDGTNITTVGSAAALGFLGEDSRITGTESLASNRGRITLAGGREDFLGGPGAAPMLLNLGTIQKVGGGQTTIAIPIDQRTNSSLTGTIQVLRGKLILVGQDFANRGLLDIQSGVLKIDLGDAGTVTNTGTIDIGSAGRFGIVGSLNNRGQGLFATEITQQRFGRATITGNIALDGTLRASFVGPGLAAGQTRRIITANARTGTFDEFLAPGTTPFLSAQPIYSAGRVAVRLQTV